MEAGREGETREEALKKLHGREGETREGALKNLKLVKVRLGRRH